MEIDIWKKGNKLIITHGNTAVNKWELNRAFEVINDYGFRWSKTPLLISIENHIGGALNYLYFMRSLRKIKDVKILKYTEVKYY